MSSGVYACRTCGTPVRVDGDPDLLPVSMRAAVHEWTGSERGSNNHLAAPIDPADLSTVPKPALDDLGINLAALEWERSGDGDGSLQVAFPDGLWERGDWVLMRTAGDPSGLILLFDRNEWACFLDGVRQGEFDGAAA